ncbi:MAG: hypothetical protein IJ880_07270 [Bacilli bacterium]|nr:hypothetical protein [Bacilli bacterium]
MMSRIDQDTIDLNKVSDIKPFSDQLFYDIKTSKMHTITSDIKVEDEKISLSFYFDKSLSMRLQLKIESFKKILLDTIKKIDADSINHKIENHSYMEKYLKEFHLHLKERYTDKFLIKLRELYIFKSGVGLISLNNGNNHISTFEKLNFQHFNDELSIHIKDVLQTALIKQTDLKKCCFKFYSLTDSKIFTVVPNQEKDIISIDDGDFCDISVSCKIIEVEDFKESDAQYSLVKEQSLIKLNETKDPDMISDLISKRHEVLEDIKSAIRKQSIVDEFADIEI